MANREATQRMLEGLHRALAEMPEQPPANVHPVLHNAQREGIQSLIAELEEALDSFTVCVDCSGVGQLQAGGDDCETCGGTGEVLNQLVKRGGANDDLR